MCWLTTLWESEKRKWNFSLIAFSSASLATSNGSITTIIYFSVPINWFRSVIIIFLLFFRRVLESALLLPKISLARIEMGEIEWNRARIIEWKDKRIFRRQNEVRFQYRQREWNANLNLDSIQYEISHITATLLCTELQQNCPPILLPSNWLTACRCIHIIRK